MKMAWNKPKNHAQRLRGSGKTFLTLVVISFLFFVKSMQAVTQFLAG